MTLATLPLDFDYVPPEELLRDCRDFGGATYDRERDGERLSGQLRRVFDLMRDGEWRRLHEIEEAVGGSATSVSARLRDLRKSKFGGFTVETRAPKDGGSWWYRLVLEEGPGP
jgi:hypothetical protein